MWKNFGDFPGKTQQIGGKLVRKRKSMWKDWDECVKMIP